MHRFASLIFSLGLVALLFALGARLSTPGQLTTVGGPIAAQGPAVVGGTNVVTAVLFAYRGLDTLGEVSILFAAATAVGLVLSRGRAANGPGGHHARAGFVLRTGADVLFPFLAVVGLFIVAHGHLTPGGGFQGGVILAAAFFLGVLARADRPLAHAAIAWLEGLAGLAFVGVAVGAFALDREFLAPLFGTGQTGALVSAGSLPLLSCAVGVKVGAELAGLMADLAAGAGASA
ncbi:MAG: sodium:proton antiporter [Chromatiales bacterium]|nr:sodium:proton antiporter [Chromatiales bacterium]